MKVYVITTGAVFGLLTSSGAVASNRCYPMAPRDVQAEAFNVGFVLPLLDP